MKSRLAACVCLSLSACITDASSSRAITLRDPLGLIENVYASGHALELYVLPSGTYACTPNTGEISPALSETNSASDAIVNVRLSRDELERREVMVPAGRYTVFARGRGTDSISGENDTTIVRACTDADVTEGSTVGVTLTLVPVVGMGICGNGVLSSDEQCETSLAECDSECRTVRENLNTTTALIQNRVRVAATSGRRVIAVWDSDASSVGVRLFDPDGRGLRGLGPLVNDFTLDELSRPEGLPGVQTSGAPAVAPDGRVAIAFVDFGMGSPHIRVGFFSDTLMRSGMYRTPYSTAAGSHARPTIAFHSSGQLGVVFEDSASSTGLMANLFQADGSLSSAEPFIVGSSQTSGQNPSIAALPNGFVVVFETRTGVHYQRFGIDGAAIDASARAVDDGSNPRSHPSVATLSDGRFLVAWTETGAPSDRMGTGVRARAFDTEGEPRGMAFQVNEVTNGDQSHATVAASDDRFIVAFESTHSIRARVFSDEGEPLLNRERPPTLGEFEVAPVGSRPAAAVIGQGPERVWWIAYEGPDNSGDIFARRFIF